jgi:sirohydrochlorin cobaltochelatase
MALYVLPLLIALAAGAPAGAQDHAGHQHAMTPDQVSELRSAVRAYAGMTDEQIMQRMQTMPPDFDVIVSAPAVQGGVGVLLLAHGMGKTGNSIVENAMAPLGASQPAAIGFGMSMHNSAHLQDAVDRLAAAGAKLIVAVPAVSTSDYNTMKRQWEYILNLRDKPAYTTVPRVQTRAVVRMSRAFDDSELIARILLDHAREISQDPGKEAVLVVGHGPERDDDNAGDLKVLQGHAQYVRENGGFADARAVNLQDDAPGPVRAANVRRLREYVETQTESGRRVLVVGFLMTTAGIQPKIQRDLDGLVYAFNTRGLSESPLFTEWVSQSVATEAARTSD